MKPNEKVLIVTYDLNTKLALHDSVTRETYDYIFNAGKKAKDEEFLELLKVAKGIRGSWDVRVQFIKSQIQSPQESETAGKCLEGDSVLLEDSAHSADISLTDEEIMELIEKDWGRKYYDYHSLISLIKLTEQKIKEKLK